MKQSFNSGTGASSILLIFVVLCLTTLGMLSLVSARADRSLALRGCESIALYYQADAAVEEALSQLDTALSEGTEAQLDQWELTDEGLYALSVPINDEKAIYTLAERREGEGPRYKIRQRILVYTGEWETDQTLDLFH